MRGDYTLEQWIGAGRLELWYKGLNKIAGIQPVDELYEQLMHYLTIITQVSTGTVNEYIDREGNTWEVIQEALANIDDDTDVDALNPFHQQARGMILLRISPLRTTTFR